VTPRPTNLFDRRARALVPATLRVALTADEILAVKAVWGPWRAAAIERLVKSGLAEANVPEHYEWDWTWKLGKLRLPGVSRSRYRVRGPDARADDADDRRLPRPKQAAAFKMKEEQQ
jgi:hypothetical protein